MDDSGILARISELVSEEHALRRRLASRDISADEEREKLRDIEVELDRAWDLLRQREAKREFGDDPDTAQERGADVVERYLG